MRQKDPLIKCGEKIDGNVIKIHNLLNFQIIHKSPRWRKSTPRRSICRNRSPRSIDAQHIRGMG